MRRFLVVYLLLFGVVLLSVVPIVLSSKSTTENNDNKNNNNDVDDESYTTAVDMIGNIDGINLDDMNDDSLIEENPNYIEPNDDDDDEDNDDHSDDDNENNNDTVEEEKSTEIKKKKKKKKETKSVLSKALGYPKSIPRKTIRLIKRHRLKILIALIGYAFRDEIKMYLWLTITEPIRDPKTGKVIGRAYVFRPKSIMKIILFIYVMLYIQKLAEQTDNDTITSSSALLLGRLTGHRGLALIVSSLLKPSNPAYIPSITQHYTFEKLNDRYTKDGMALTKALGPQLSTLTQSTTSTAAATTTSNSSNVGEKLQQQLSLKPKELMSMLRSNEIEKLIKELRYNSTIIVLDWTELDSSVSCMDGLRDEVSFLITEYRNRRRTTVSSNNININNISPFEIIIMLQSPGGSAADYALASQQVLRLRNEGITVTICVDKVAASGGYMIACMASPGRLYAAPFAVLGSIGVIGQTINVHKVLEGWGVKPLVFRGGPDKAPVGLIGEVTNEGMKKVQQMVDDTHRAFKRHVVEYRPVLTDQIDKIATGDIWLGYDALDVQLIDRIITSDEYLTERMQHGARVLKLSKIVKRHFLSKPTTSSVRTSAAATANSILFGDDHRRLSSLLSLLSDFRSLLDKATTTLGSMITTDDSRVDLSSASTMMTMTTSAKDVNSNFATSKTSH